MSGYSKGSIIFLKIGDLERVYARIAFHRAEVRQVRELNHKGHFFSICSEHIMNFWGFEEGDEKVSLFQTFNLYREVSFISFLENNLLFVFSSGDTELFEWKVSPPRDKSPSGISDGQIANRYQDLWLLHREKPDEHDSEINDVDSKSHGLKLFVTGGEDGFVKVWDQDKRLVREIKFPDPIKTVCFKNSDFDILVGHGAEVSLIRASDYQPSGTPK